MRGEKLSSGGDFCGFVAERRVQTAKHSAILSAMRDKGNG
jgi:hypothetical protein